MPNFAGARAWVDKIDAAAHDKEKLDKWIEKVEAEYARLAKVDTALYDATERILELEAEAAEVQALTDRIRDHRLGLLTDEELHRAAGVLGPSVA